MKSNKIKFNGGTIRDSVNIVLCCVFFLYSIVITFQALFCGVFNEYTTTTKRNDKNMEKKVSDSV